MFGPNAHGLFKTKFIPAKKRPFLSRFRDPLTLGNSSYYINDETFHTRVYLYNYFQFLLDTEFSAKWRIRLYGRDGRFIAQLHGDFSGGDTAVVDLTDVPGLDIYGVVRAYIIPTSREAFIPDVHITMFCNEYYKPDSPTAIMAHNLHIPIATHGTGLHQRVSPGLVIPEGFEAYLFIAGGCNFHPFGHPACTNAFLTFVDEKGAARHVVVPPMKPLACQRLDLFAMDPGLRAHIGTQPFTLKITGQGFLAKPFFLFTNGTIALGEHT